MDVLEGHKPKKKIMGELEEIVQAVRIRRGNKTHAKAKKKGRVSGGWEGEPLERRQTWRG